MKVKELILSKIGNVPFFKTISMQLEMTNETGSRLRITYSDKHKNIWGTVAGGVIASLVDATCGLSIIPLLNDDEMMMTAGLQVQYFLPVKSGDVVGHGRVVHRGKRLAYAEANIFDEQGKLIAKGHASFMIMSGTKYLSSAIEEPLTN
ncbi:MAG: PaaI family thioesterase [Syntrophaceae bacterium]